LGLLRYRVLFLALLLLAATLAACMPGEGVVRERFLVFASRGASGHAPENTIPAFDRAVELGADYIEFDVHMSRDGVLVLVHDDTLDRTARGSEENCTGPVAEKSFEQLRTCDVGSWFNDEHPRRAREEYEGLKIPTLAEVFGRYGDRVGLYVDLKHPEAAPEMDEEVLRLMDEHGLLRNAAEEPMIISFNRERLRNLHDLEPSVRLVQLLSSGRADGPDGEVLEGIEEYAAAVGPPAGRVDDGLVGEAHDRGLEVYPYTVNRPAKMRRLIEHGVDGMGTDFPDRLDRVLRRCVLAGETDEEVPPNCF
jgi:glycerophosphoryl diester phosphodiesterase